MDGTGLHWDAWVQIPASPLPSCVALELSTLGFPSRSPCEDYEITFTRRSPQDLHRESAVSQHCSHRGCCWRQATATAKGKPELWGPEATWDPRPTLSLERCSFPLSFLFSPFPLPRSSVVSERPLTQSSTGVWKEERKGRDEGEKGRRNGVQGQKKWGVAWESWTFPQCPWAAAPKGSD